jgi:hypothetical protein
LKQLDLPLSVWQLKRVDFQYLEDKCSRLVEASSSPWPGARSLLDR